MRRKLAILLLLASAAWPAGTRFSARWDITVRHSPRQEGTSASGDTKLEWTGARAPEIGDADDGSWGEGQPVDVFNRRDISNWHGLTADASPGWTAEGGIPKGNAATDVVSRPLDRRSNAAVYSYIAPSVGRHVTVTTQGIVDGLAATACDPDEGAPGPRCCRAIMVPVEFRSIIPIPPVK